MNLRHSLAVEFLRRWYDEARDGLAFRGIRDTLSTWGDYQDVKWNRAGRVSPDPGVRGHRHDQTVAGILAHRLGMTLTARGLQPYSHRRRALGYRTAILIDRDVAGSEARLTTIEQARRDRYLGHFGELIRRASRRPRD